LTCKRTVSVFNVHGSQRYGNRRGDQRTHPKGEHRPTPACESLSQQRVHGQEIRSKASPARPHMPRRRRHLKGDSCPPGLAAARCGTPPEIGGDFLP
jgi:hypothetical protein